MIKALRSHDERLNWKINKADVTGDLPDNICVIKLNQFYSPDGFYDQKGFDTDQPTTNPALKYTLATEVDLKSIAKSFTAATVEKCGDRFYWDDWSKNLDKIIKQIKQQLDIY
ncbi:hypothetical protein [[Mycoplasma] cavipharyngis]|uniref:hypothetical protein n=1 Tax=[Mycoplasma] cavipharyngis TaxID=92757 RepID=UPI00370466AB